MKIFGSGNARYLTKERMTIKKYEETEVNHVSELVLVMVYYDIISTSCATYEVNKITVAPQ